MRLSNLGVKAMLDPSFTRSNFFQRRATLGSRPKHLATRSRVMVVLALHVHLAPRRDSRLPCATGSKTPHHQTARRCDTLLSGQSSVKPTMHMLPPGCAYGQLRTDLNCGLFCKDSRTLQPRPALQLVQRCPTSTPEIGPVREEPEVDPSRSRHVPATSLVCFAPIAAAVKPASRDDAAGYLIGCGFDAQWLSMVIHPRRYHGSTRQPVYH